MLNLKGKGRTAIALLKKDGLAALLQEFARRFKRLGPAAPDEMGIVFRLLHDSVGGARQPVMIDVGAHFGDALAPFARRDWQVFAFEPDPQNRETLDRGFGSSTNVHIDPRGVSDEAVKGVAFYTSSISSGISGLSAFHPSHAPAGTIDLTTLDRFCTEKDVRHVDFLKIDTEGFDLFVLRGFPWQRITPRVIVCEFEDSKTLPLGYSFHDLAAFLQQRGYRIVVSEWYPIEKYGGLHDWRRFLEYPCELKDPRGWGNLIAVSSDELFHVLVKICRGSGRQTRDIVT